LHNEAIKTCTDFVSLSHFETFNTSNYKKRLYYANEGTNGSKTSKPTTHRLTVIRWSQFTRKRSTRPRTHNVRLLGTSKDCSIQTPSKQNYISGRVTKMQGRMAEKELINPFTVRKR